MFLKVIDKLKKITKGSHIFNLLILYLQKPSIMLKKGLFVAILMASLPYAGAQYIDVDSIYTQCIVDDIESEHFNKLLYAYQHYNNENHVLAAAFFDADLGSITYEFDIGYKEPDKNGLVGLLDYGTYTYDDFDNLYYINYYFYLRKGVGTSIQLDLNVSHFGERFEKTYYLTGVRSTTLSLRDSSLLMIGVHESPSIESGPDLISQRSDTTIGVTYFDSQLQFQSQTNISGLDNTYAPIVTKPFINGHYMFVRKGEAGGITVDGDSFEVAAEYVVFEINDSTTLFRSFSKSPGISVTDIARSQRGELGVLLHGKGTFDGIDFDEGTHMVHYDSTGTLTFFKSLLGNKIDAEKQSLSFSNDPSQTFRGSLDFAVTFEEEVDIDGKAYISHGGTDILLVSMDTRGNLIQVNQYGTEVHETVSEIFTIFLPSEDANFIFLGGDYASSIDRRVIGNVELINTIPGHQKGYLAWKFIAGSDYKAGPRAATTPYAVSITHQKKEPELVVYPNPSSDFININYSNEQGSWVELSIIDPLGRIYKDLGRLYLDYSRFSERIDISDLQEGLYFLQLKNSQGKISTQNFVVTR